MGKEQERQEHHHLLQLWLSTHQDVFDIQVVNQQNYNQWVFPSSLPISFETLEPRAVQEDVLRVALLAHFGGISVDVSSVPGEHHGLWQIWKALETSDVEALSTYNYREHCKWELGMWFLAAKKNSAYMEHWNHLMIQQLDGAQRSAGSESPLQEAQRRFFKDFKCPAWAAEERHRQGTLKVVCFEIRFCLGFSS